MSETMAVFKTFATTPVGVAVLIGVGAIVVVAGGIPLWRAVKYLFKASLWALLVFLVVVLGVGAVWLWVSYRTVDPGQRDVLKREAVETIRGEFGKVLDGKGAPGASKESGHGQ